MHFKKIVKQDALGDLGKEMNSPVDESKKEMKNVLSSLRREEMKMKKSNGTGKGEYLLIEIFMHFGNAYILS
jgi:hypothetical protein